MLRNEFYAVLDSFNSLVFSRETEARARACAKNDDKDKIVDTDNNNNKAHQLLWK